MDELLPAIIVQSFGMGPDFVEVTYQEAAENVGSAQHSHVLAEQMAGVEDEVADVQEALCALVDKILLNNRNPPATVASRRRPTPIEGHR